MGDGQRIDHIETLRLAWDKVRQRGAGPGIDRCTIDAYGGQLEERLTALARRLAAGTWRAAPGRRIHLAEDPERPIVVSTVEDRIVQRALVDVLAPFYEGIFTEAARAYRPGMSLNATYARVDRLLTEGKRWFVRTDITRFFESIDRERLLTQMAADGVAPASLRVVREILRAGVVEGLAWHDPDAGIPQGSALSPLLSNVYLRAMDDAMLSANHAYLRYADDILVLGSDESTVADGATLLVTLIEQQGMQINRRKTQRGHVRDGFVYLGMRFDTAGRRIAAPVLSAVSARASALSTSGDPFHAMADLMDEAVHWYGPRVLDWTDALVLLAAVVFQQVRLGSPMLLPRLATRRRERPRDESLPAELHVMLVEAWAQVDDPACDVARLVDARAALRHPLSDEARDRLSAALRMPARLLGALSATSDRLVETVARSGATRLAAAARALGDPSPAPPLVHSGGALIPDDFQLERWMSRIRGRTDTHVAEHLDPDGHYALRAVHGALMPDAVRDHLAGARRYGIHVVEAGEQVRLATIECRVRRDMLVPAAGHAGEASATADTLRAWQNRVHDDAVAISHAARKQGLNTVIESTGAHQRRLWFVFSGPIALRHAHALLRLIDEWAGPLTAGLIRVLTPPADRLHQTPGPALILPLGRHPRTRAWSTLVRHDGEPCERPLDTLVGAAVIDVRHILELVCRLPATAHEAAADSLPTLGPRAGRVLGACNVLRAFAQKANRLGQLEPMERATVLESLGHLPPAEIIPTLRAFLPAPEQSDDALRRRVEKLPPCPVSCARVRQRHAAVSLEVGCECVFVGLREGEYPTPLLHGMAPKEIAGFRREQRPTPAREIAPPRPQGPPPQLIAAIDLWRRRMRHFEDATRTADEAGRQVAESLDALGVDRIRVSDGFIERIRTPPFVRLVPSQKTESGQRPAQE